VHLVRVALAPGRLRPGRGSSVFRVLQQPYLDFANFVVLALALGLAVVAGLAAASRTSLIFSRLAMRALRNLFSRDRSPLRYDMEYLSGAGSTSTLGPLMRSQADPQLGE